MKWLECYWCHAGQFRDDVPKELLCAVWPEEKLFHSRTELEAAE